MPRFHRLTIAAASGALLIAACSDTTPPAPCTEGGVGDLAVSVIGLPAGAIGNVVISGPAGTFSVTATQTIGGIASGTYTVAPAPIGVADSLIDRVYAAGNGSASVCVRDGATQAVIVGYAKVATSGSLWLGAGYYGLGFTSAQLGTTATLSPTVTAATRGGAGLAFDKQGNLWVRGQTASEPVLMRYSSFSLAASGNPIPDRTIGITGLDCVTPGSLAFDPSGNLWMSLGCQGRVVRLTPAQLGASGNVTPAVQITGLTNPQGLAFDGAGNLWIADYTHLRRFDAARLTASINTAADLSVSFTTPSPPTPGVTGLSAMHVAFRPNGELWVGSTDARALYRVEAAVASGTGTQGTQVSRIVYFNDFTQPKGFAFDNAGGLYVAFEQSKLARLAPSQLEASSTPAAPTVPQRVIASGNILGFGDDVALFPAPATTPLYHRVP